MSSIDLINVILVLTWSILAIVGFIRIMLYENRRGNKDDKSL